jgi:hypothetical protein
VFDVDLMIFIDRVGGRMKFSHRPFKGIFNPLIIKLERRVQKSSIVCLVNGSRFSGGVKI